MLCKCSHAFTPRYVCTIYCIRCRVCFGDGYAYEYSIHNCRLCIVIYTHKEILSCAWRMSWIVGWDVRFSRWPTVICDDCLRDRCRLIFGCLKCNMKCITYTINGFYICSNNDNFEHQKHSHSIYCIYKNMIACNKQLWCFSIVYLDEPLIVWSTFFSRIITL